MYATYDNETKYTNVQQHLHKVRVYNFKKKYIQAIDVTKLALESLLCVSFVLKTVSLKLLVLT